MPQPSVPAYLSRSYAATPGVLGGTLLAEDVRELAEHEVRVTSPAGYRPECCPRCGRNLKGHGVRYRTLRDEPQAAEVMIRRYYCPPCPAVWQVLPGFVSRFLHRTWGAVQSGLVAAGTLKPGGGEWRVRRKPTTWRRWSVRLAMSARLLVQVLAGGGADIAAVLEAGWSATRAELVEALATEGLVEPCHKLSQMAIWVHRLAPGVRLM